MDLQLKEHVMKLWKKYFNNADLPIVFWYTDEEKLPSMVKPPSEHRCLIDDLIKVRKGESLCFSGESIGCGGGKRYLGFTEKLGPNFEYFLSCGIPGMMQGERYKKSPELVKEVLKTLPRFKAPSRFVVFKRWDMLEEKDTPAVAIFFAHPDVISGLLTLANYDEVEQDGVISPFSSGCGSIMFYPYLELSCEHPRAVLGMFDVSARPYVSEDILTFSVPLSKFTTMVGNMEESFLITSSWDRVQKRISGYHAG